MDQFTINLLFVGASFALYIGIAIWARAGSTSGILCRRSRHSPGHQRHGDRCRLDVGAASFISMAGLIAVHRLRQLHLPDGLDRRLRAAGVAACALPAQVRQVHRAGIHRRRASTARRARVVAVICLLVASAVPILTGQMTRGRRSPLSRFLEVANTAGLLIGACVVFAYAVFGGMKGVTYTQVAQYVVLIMAYTIPAVFISLQLTGNPIPRSGSVPAMSNPVSRCLQKLDQVRRPNSGLPQNTPCITVSTFDMCFCITLSLMIGTAGLPHVIMRFFTVPRVADAVGPLAGRLCLLRCCTSLPRRLVRWRV